MSRMFPKLGPRAVEFRSSNGAVFFVRMLPIRMWDDFTAIAEAAQADSTPENRTLGRARLRAMLETVWPQEHLAELLRLDFTDSLEIADRLFFGEERQPEKAKAKPPSRNRPDMEFLAAQMLTVYPGYTLDALLDLPIPVFFRLQGLAARVRADDTLERYSPAVAAALCGGEIIRELRNIRGEIMLPGDSPETAEASSTLTPEQAAELDAKLDRILAGDSKMTGPLKPGRKAD